MNNFRLLLLSSVVIFLVSCGSSSVADSSATGTGNPAVAVVGKVTIASSDANKARANQPVVGAAVQVRNTYNLNHPHFNYLDTNQIDSLGLVYTDSNGVYHITIDRNDSCTYRIEIRDRNGRYGVAHEFTTDTIADSLMTPIHTLFPLDTTYGVLKFEGPFSLAEIFVAYGGEYSSLSHADGSFQIVIPEGPFRLYIVPEDTINYEPLFVEEPLTTGVLDTIVVPVLGYLKDTVSNK